MTASKSKVRVVRASKSFERKISSAMAIGQRFECLQLALSSLGHISPTIAVQAADVFHKYVVNGIVSGQPTASVTAITLTKPPF